MSINAASRPEFLSTASVLRIHGPFDWSTASVGSRVMPASSAWLRSARLFLAGLGIDLAGFQVHQILGHETAEQAVRPTSTSLVFSAMRRAWRCVSLASASATTSPVAASMIGSSCFTPRNAVGIERPRPALWGTVEHHLAVEVTEDFLGFHGEAYRAGAARSARTAPQL